jgi:hypothetical protein
MKVLRNVTRSLPLLLAASLASAGVSWSPIACSCLSAWEDIATGLGRFDLKSPDQLTPRLVADAVKAKFSGKAVSASDMPFAFSTYDCADSSSPERAVRCRWWLWESSGGSKKGYDVVVSTTPQGVFQRVSVTPVQYMTASDRK